MGFKSATIEGCERSEVAIFAMQVRLKEPTDQAWVEKSYGQKLVTA